MSDGGDDWWLLGGVREIPRHANRIQRRVYFDHSLYKLLVQNVQSIKAHFADYSEGELQFHERSECFHAKGWYLHVRNRIFVVHMSHTIYPLVCDKKAGNPANEKANRFLQVYSFFNEPLQVAVDLMTAQERSNAFIKSSSKRNSHVSAWPDRKYETKQCKKYCTKEQLMEPCSLWGDKYIQSVLKNWHKFLATWKI